MKVLHLDLHPTSITRNRDTFIVVSLEGDMVFLDIHTRNIKYIIKDAHTGRIWKVSTNGNQIATIGTDGYLKTWSADGKMVSSWKDAGLPTTCLLNTNQVYIANNNEEYGDFLLPDEQKRNELLSRHGTVFFIDNNPTCKAAFERLEKIMKGLDVDYRVENLEGNLEQKQFISEQSGWDRFPQVFFSGKFIGAGSVLMEMDRTKTLQRLVNNMYSEFKL
jgi:glutaredoxin-related protein